MCVCVCVRACVGVCLRRGVSNAAEIAQRVVSESPGIHCGLGAALATQITGVCLRVGVWVLLGVCVCVCACVRVCVSDQV